MTKHYCIEYEQSRQITAALLEALARAADRLEIAAEELANELSGSFSIWADEARAAIRAAKGG